MNHYKTMLAIAWIVLSFLNPGNLLAQSTGNPSLDEVKRQIEASQAIYFNAIAKGDSSLFVSQYTEDCCILLPGAPAKCGRDAASEFFKQIYHRSGWRIGKFITIDVFGDAKEFVSAVGFWHAYSPANGIFDRGKFHTLWKKTPSGWKMYRDAVSSDLPE